MFQFNKPHSGSLLLCFAKVIIIKIYFLIIITLSLLLCFAKVIIIKIFKNVVMNQFGRVSG